MVVKTFCDKEGCKEESSCTLEMTESHFIEHASMKLDLCAKHFREFKKMLSKLEIGWEGTGDYAD